MFIRFQLNCICSNDPLVFLLNLQHNFPYILKCTLHLLTKFLRFRQIFSIFLLHLLVSLSLPLFPFLSFLGNLHPRAFSQFEIRLDFQVRQRVKLKSLCLYYTCDDELLLLHHTCGVSRWLKTRNNTFLNNVCLCASMRKGNGKYFLWLLMFL